MKMSSVSVSVRSVQLEEEGEYFLEVCLYLFVQVRSV